VVAQQTCRKFYHRLDTGGDTSAGASFGAAALEAVKVRAVPENEFHKLSLGVLDRGEHLFKYTVNVEPPLQPGERLGYQRTFVVPNRFPVTQGELRERSAREGYPRGYPPGFYGEFIDVSYDTGRVEFGLHFPEGAEVAEYTAVVVDFMTGDPNGAETERCRRKEHLRLETDECERRQTLQFTLPHPLRGHSYRVFYRPG